MKLGNNSLWGQRDTLVRIKPLAATVLAAASALLAATAASVLGSGFLLCISGVILAFLFAADRSIISLAAVPAAYLFSLLFTRDLTLSLTSLLFLPFGLALAICVMRQLSLSHTTVVMTVMSALCVGVLFAVWTVDLYGGTLTESFKLYLADLRSVYGQIADMIVSVTDEAGISLISRDALDSLASSVKLILPGILVLMCELWAYGSAKLFRLFSIIFKCGDLFRRPWKVSVALPTSALFVVCFVICMFAPGNSKNDIVNIIAYSAANLMYILLPLSAISGFHAMFGVGGAFRRSRSVGFRVLLIVMCGVSFFINPLMLCAMLAIWGAFESMRRSSFEKRKNGRGDGSGDDPNSSDF